MKNVKLFLSTVVAFLVVGISTVYAQQKQSVMVSEDTRTDIVIEVIKPDYSIDVQNYKVKEMNASMALKKELDKWIEQGFEIKSSITQPAGYIVSYILIKEE